MRPRVAYVLALMVALTAVAGWPATGRAGPSGPTAQVDPEVQAAVRALGPQETISVIVKLRDQADLRAIPATAGPNRVTSVVTALRAKADASQRGLRTLLDERSRQGQVSRSASFWVFNGFAVTATRDVIQELAARPDVLSIEPDRVIPAPTPVASSIQTSTAAEANINLINAPTLWDLGFQGQGVVVASLDTGVDYTHPDLASQWRGGGNSWYDPWGEHPTVPADRSGHGTWTMGVMVGRDNGGTAIGVAPQASWIAAKIFNDGGTSTSSVIHQSFQWVLDPDGDPLTPDAPHIVNNSWSLSSPGCFLDFEFDLQSLVAAGIAPVFAAGNFGPNDSTSASPGNNPSAFAVGATDDNDVIGSFSSRGPTDCGTGSTRTFPGVVAPGVNTRTSDLFGLYYSPSGTSMSAPHVSGALALLLDARPGLTVEQQRAALSSTTLDLGPAGPDEAYGAGRIDVLAAYNSIADVGPLTTSVSITPNPTNGSAEALLSAVIDDTTTGDSSVDAAEYFVDTPGADGTGTAMNGAFGSPAVSVSATISTDVLAGLAIGNHVFYVRGHDATGNWGPMGTAELTVDRAGPAVSGVSATPNPTAGSSSVNLTAVAADPANGDAPPSSIAAAEWFEGTDPGAGNGSPMQAADGAFDNASENVAATVDVSGWSDGDHTLSVRAKDAAGNWGPASATTLTVTVSDIIFADGFETGDFGAWSSVSGDASRISVAPEAAMSGAFGLKAAISGKTPSYVTDATPANETSYRARFYFHSNGTATRGRAHDIFVGQSGGGTAVFRIQYRLTTKGLYQIRAGVLRSGGTTYTTWKTISNVAHPIEIVWQSGTSASFSLYIDWVLVQTLSGLNTSAYRLDSVRLGPSAGLASGMSGSEYYDAFVSTRGTYVGP